MKKYSLLVSTAAVLVVCVVMYGLSFIIVPLFSTLNMGYAGLLIRTGLYALLLVSAIWYVVGFLRRRAAKSANSATPAKSANSKADKTGLWAWVISTALFSVLIIGTIRDLSTPPVTRDFTVRFYKPSGGRRGNFHEIQMYATPLDGEGESERFLTTRFERIEGVPRYSRRNLPPGRYKMRITYYPHSRTRVSTELLDR